MPKDRSYLFPISIVIIMIITFIGGVIIAINSEENTLSSDAASVYYDNELSMCIVQARDVRIGTETIRKHKTLRSVDRSSDDDGNFLPSPSDLISPSSPLGQAHYLLTMPK